MARLYVLGGGGWFPTAKRSTNCYLVETRRAAVLLDCGEGVARLGDPMFRAVLDRVSRVLVLLSHYHHDHVSGLHYLPHFLKNHEVALCGPPSKLCRVPPSEMLERIAGTGTSSRPINRWPELFEKGVEIVELKEGRNRVLGETVEVSAQPHTDPCVAFRVRDVAYVTDTTARPETSVFVKKAGILIHDAWLDDDDRAAGAQNADGHSAASGAATIARDAEVGALILGHLNPTYDEARLERMRFDAARVFANTHLADDFASFDIRIEDEEETMGDESLPAATAAGE